MDGLSPTINSLRNSLGQECTKAVISLRDLLRQHEVPADYKVAVIGRFKVGNLPRSW